MEIPSVFKKRRCKRETKIKREHVRSRAIRFKEQDSKIYTIQGIEGEKFLTLILKRKNETVG